MVRFRAGIYTFDVRFNSHGEKLYVDATSDEQLGTAFFAVDPGLPLTHAIQECVSKANEIFRRDEGTATKRRPMLHIHVYVEPVTPHSRCTSCNALISERELTELLT